MVLLRGVAAMLVCFIHINMFSSFHVSKYIDYVISNGGEGVIIFFVISGFILPYSLYVKDYKFDGFWRFLFKRSIRIDPPYWATIILTLVFMPVSWFSFKSILLHLTYLVPFFKGEGWYNHIFWTLSIEFQFYLLLGMFYPLLMRINPYRAIGCLILSGILFITFKFNSDGIIFTYLYDFIVGFIVFLGFIKKISQRNMILILLLFSGYLMISVSIKSGIIPLLTSLFIIFYTERKSIPGLSFIGNISYSLYLTHTIVGYVFVQYVHKLIANSNLLFILTFGICILFAYLFYTLIEKPSIKFSKSIKLSNSSAQAASLLPDTSSN
ncbi:MAG: acyltransferase family protein [Mucilaginibacter sp.]